MSNPSKKPGPQSQSPVWDLIGEVRFNVFIG